VAIARVIRQQTTVSMGWIAEHLSMGSAPNASQQILRMGNLGKTLPESLETWVALSENAAFSESVSQPVERNV